VNLLGGDTGAYLKVLIATRLCDICDFSVPLNDSPRAFIVFNLKVFMTSVDLQDSLNLDVKMLN